MTALVVLAIVTVGVTAVYVTRREHRHHAHMRPLRYHDDLQWRAFDAAMTKHSKGAAR